jgi:hypothetical protein
MPFQYSLHLLALTLTISILLGKITWLRRNSHEIMIYISIGRLIDLPEVVWIVKGHRKGVAKKMVFQTLAFVSRKLKISIFIVNDIKIIQDSRILQLTERYRISKWRIFEHFI